MALCSHLAKNVRVNSNANDQGCSAWTKSLAVPTPSPRVVRRIPPTLCCNGRCPARCLGEGERHGPTWFISGQVQPVNTGASWGKGLGEEGLQVTGLQVNRTRGRATMQSLTSKLLPRPGAGPRSAFVWAQAWQNLQRKRFQLWLVETTVLFWSEFPDSHRVNQ